MANSSVVARILTQYSAKGTKEARKDVANLSKSFDHFAKRAKQSFALVGAASVAMALKIGKDAVQAATEDQKSQALLANSLRNTLGATDETIAGVERYISKQQALIGVTDEQLRPSLTSLTQATGDVGKAQELQGLALDIAANRGKDLASVSLALSKAYLGNFTALRKMGIPLSDALIKSKDFAGVQAELARVTQGAAATAANTFAGRMARMAITFDEIKETLGYALIPVLQKFADYVAKNIIPKIEAWVNLNKDKLAASLQSAGEQLVNIGMKLAAVGIWITSHMGYIKAFGILMASIWTYGKAMLFLSALSKIKAAFVALRGIAISTGIASAFATGGASVAAATAALAVAGLGTAWALAGSNADSAGSSFANAASKIPTGLGGPLNSNGEVISIKQAKYQEWLIKHNAFLRRKAANDEAKQAKILADQQKKQKAAELADLKKKQELQKALNALTKLGSTPTSETDPIQLEAARQNLVKQGLLLQDAQTQAQLKQLQAMSDTASAASRYQDVLKALSDGKLSDAEIINLSVKWGISTDAVKKYIEGTGLTFTLDPSWIDPVTAIGTAWDSATTKALAYLAAVTGIQFNGNTGGLTGGGNYSGDDSNDRRNKTTFDSNTSDYGSQSPVIDSSKSFAVGGANSVAAGVTINVNGTILDTGGFHAAVQDAYQTLVRTGSPLGTNDR